MDTNTIKINCYIEGIRVPVLNITTKYSRDSIASGTVTIPLGKLIETKAFASAFVQVTFVHTINNLPTECLFFEGLCTDFVLEEEKNIITLALISKFDALNYNTTLDYVSPKKYGLSNLEEGVRLWVGTETVVGLSNANFTSKSLLSDRYIFRVDEDLEEIDPADSESNKLFWILNRYPFAERLAFSFFEDIVYSNFHLSKAYINRFNLLAKASDARTKLADQYGEEALIKTTGFVVRSDPKRGGLEDMITDRKYVSKNGCKAPDSDETGESVGLTPLNPQNIAITIKPYNFQDILANDPRARFCNIYGSSPKFEHWCTLETANALLEAGKLIYQKFNTPLTVGDLSILEKDGSLVNRYWTTSGNATHKEHKLGHVADLYIEGATNTRYSNYDYKRSIECINILGSVGAVSVGFLDPPNQAKFNAGCRILVRPLEGHWNHYHVRFFY